MPGFVQPFVNDECVNLVSHNARHSIFHRRRDIPQQIHFTRRQIALDVNRVGLTFGKAMHRQFRQNAFDADDLSDGLGKESVSIFGGRFFQGQQTQLS